MRKIKIDPLQCLAIPLGRVGENNATEIVFDLNTLISEFGEGVIDILHQRSGDEQPYPVSTVRDGQTLTWTVGSADVQHYGVGQAELILSVGGQVAKSIIFQTYTAEALGCTADPPEPWVPWVNQILSAAETVNGFLATLEGGEVGQVWTKTEDGAEWAEQQGGGGTGDHAQLTNRDAADQHPMSAITGLSEAVADAKASGLANVTWYSDVHRVLQTGEIEALAGRRTTSKFTLSTGKYQLSADTSHSYVDINVWDGETYLGAIEFNPLGSGSNAATFCAVDFYQYAITFHSADQPIDVHLEKLSAIAPGMRYAVLLDGTEDWQDESTGVALDITSVLAARGYNVSSVKDSIVSVNAFAKIKNGDVFSYSDDWYAWEIVSYSGDVFLKSHNYTLADDISAALAAKPFLLTINDGYADISGKVDKQQSASDAGKVLGIGDDGRVVPVTGGGAPSADAVSYDNSESGLTADDVQTAIDELVEICGDVEATINAIRGVTV